MFLKLLIGVGFLGFCTHYGELEMHTSQFLLSVYGYHVLIACCDTPGFLLDYGGDNL